ncbi:MAG: hypothetical protein L6Q75_14695 [Burkholderiaceae bacterium]|nr:hypothetical protein [Burkholderiaceae bacterium]
MGFLDALNHLLNLLLPALVVAAIAAGLAKGLWRRELAAVPWRRLWEVAALGNVGVLLAGLLLLGRDGRMSVYLAMVAVTALTLWWRGFGPGRRG